MTWNIEGKRVLVTGGTAGIGRATVEGLARLGAEVVFTARDPQLGDEIVAEVAAATGNRSLSHRRLDLDDLAAVRRFATAFREEFDRLDVLINNAGVVMTKRRLTADGHEFTFGVNHLGHFVLVNELLALLEASAPSRIVILASDAHKFVGGLRFDDLDAAKGRFGAGKGMAVYSRSKLANMLHTRELARRLPVDQVTVNCVHPGSVRTRLGREQQEGRIERALTPLSRRFFISPEEGARTSIWAATSPELSAVTGRYLANEEIAEPKKTALDDGAATRLWAVSEALTG